MPALLGLLFSLRSRSELPRKADAVVAAIRSPRRRQTISGAARSMPTRNRLKMSCFKWEWNDWRSLQEGRSKEDCIKPQQLYWCHSCLCAVAFRRNRTIDFTRDSGEGTRETGEERLCKSGCKAIVIINLRDCYNPKSATGAFGCFAPFFHQLPGRCTFPLEKGKTRLR